MNDVSRMLPSDWATFEVFLLDDIDFDFSGFRLAVEFSTPLCSNSKFFLTKVITKVYNCCQLISTASLRGKVDILNL